MSNSGSETLVSLFVDRIASDGGNPALRTKRDGQYAVFTWNDVANEARRTAVVLADLGVEPGDRVIQVAENRHEWIIADLAIQLARAIHVPVHAPLTGPQVAYQIKNSGAKVVLMSNAEQIAKLSGCADSLPADLIYVSYEPNESTIGGRPIETLAELAAAADDDAARQIERDALAHVAPDSLATILYTSGTTGEPKGVVLNQRNLVTNTLATLQAFRMEPDDLRLTFLPLSHIFARTCDLYTWIAVGCELALAESRDTVVADAAAIKPTLINGVPYFFDKIQRALVELGRADQEGSLRDLLGGRVRVFCSGGAALPDHVFDFYAQQGLPIHQGYGLTETSPVITASTPERNRRGCVGPPIPDVEVKIAADGEILTRGPHVMVGYYKNDEATREMISDGWLYTGDLGELTSDGLLKITGRKKEIIVTSGGKNVAPVLLESLLTEDPLILQALVVGDGRNYLAALIVPDPDNLRSEIITRRIPVASADAALRHPDVLALYDERIKSRLSVVSHYEQVRKFRLLNRGFTIESGELTPKLSLRRNEIQANFAAEIEAMFQR